MIFFMCLYRQNEELLLLSHLARTFIFGDLKIQFQSSVYIFSGC